MGRYKSKIPGSQYAPAEWSVVFRLSGAVSNTGAIMRRNIRH